MNLIFVQRGTITLTGTATATATITAVDTTRSVVVYLGNRATTTSGARPEWAFTNITLTNATTVTATRSATSGDIVISYAVVEYAPGTISAQRGVIALTSTSATATITSVILARSYVMFGGTYGDTTSALWERTLVDLVLTNATTVTATRGVTTDNAWVTFQVVTW